MNYFLIGYYGFNNTGDDICLLKTKEIILSTNPKSKFIILSSPAENQKNHINRNNIPLVIKTIYKSTQLVLGGGSILQTASSTKSLLYYLFVICCGLLLKKPIYFLGQGIGPIKHKSLQLITRLICSHATKASLRSQSAIPYFKKQHKQKLISDISFYKAPIFNTKNNATPLVAINLRNNSINKKYYSNLVLSLNKYNLNVNGLSFCPSIDTKCLLDSGINKKNIFHINKNNFYNRSKIPYTMIIAMRYHCCIWAILQGIPFFAISYDKKVTELAQETNQPYIKTNDIPINSTPLISLIYQELEHLDQLKNHILTSQKQMVLKAEHHKWVFTND